MGDHTAPHGPAPPLVGRAREQALLREHLDRALAGRGGLVLLGGAAGIGKTALLEDLCRGATGRGATVLVGPCYDLAETPPYGPWAEVLNRWPPIPDLLPRPALLGATDSPKAAEPQAARFARLRDFLLTAAARRPLVLALEDLHWADPASLDLLRFVGRRLADAPLLLLGTYRAEELHRGHPLYALLPTLVRETRATRLDLHPLGDDAMGALVRVRHALTPWDEARLVSYLGERAGGNPFYAGELLRALEEEGVLRPVPVGGDGAGWTLGGLAAVPVPALLRQVIDARVARLGEGAYRLLGLAATIGQEVPLALWRAVGAGDDAVLAGVVERAVATRVLTEAPEGGGVRFVHALIREALYEGVPLPRRQGWHRRIGEALLTATAPDPDAVAYHLRWAADPRAALWLIRAGDRAHQARALVTAGERYAGALAILEVAGADARERGWPAYRLALTHEQAEPERALRELDRAAVLAEAAGDRALRAGIAFSRGSISGTAGQMRRGIAAIEVALPIIAALPPAERERIWATGDVADAAQYDPRGLLVEFLAATGRFADALALAAQIVPAVPSDGAAPEAPPAVSAHAYRGLAIAHAGRGRPGEARRAFAAARRCTLATGNDGALGLLAREELAWVALPYQADRLADRRQLADGATAAWRRASGARGDIPPAAATMALLLVEGRWAEARAVAEGVRATRLSGPPRMIANGVLAFLAREMGDRATARARAIESLPAPDAEPGDTYLLNTLPVQRVAALVALDRGDLPAARAWLEAHDRWLTWSGATLGRAEGHLGWSAYARTTGDLAQARAQAEQALADATEPRQPLALLAARRLLGELDTADGRHAEARAHLDQALALADACAAPYERALTLLVLADLRAVTGDRAGATTALDEARAILDPLGARPALDRAEALAARLLPPGVPPRAYPAGLSAREGEVLRLVAQGLTNAQVAARLFVAPRTVNAHLTNIFTKLDVSSRTAATRFAIEHGLA